MITLDTFQQHRYKPILQFYGITQAPLAITLGISQSSLSNQLNGIVPMQEHVENEISELIISLREKQSKTKKYHKIIKKR